MMHFKIFSGFNDNHPLSIDETELTRALGAQFAGKNATVVLKHGSINGAFISKITPDFDKVEKTYNPSGPDRLPRGTEEAHYLAIENAGEIVKAKLENRQPQLKSPSVRIHTQGLTAIGGMLPKTNV